ncbi:MAG: HAD-IIB family hydrolase [Sideroxyarcus sp.]|nr:HAD-IIB family hydrolase [Sideroxyarcus sp.]
MPDTLIISDLDGTLLDRDYSCVAAAPALDLIRERGIPLVLCSSKTRAEVEYHRRQLHNTHPFITENGAGIYIPHDYFRTPPDGEAVNGYMRIRLGMTIVEIRERFVHLRERLAAKVRGFADMTDDEVATLTSLPRNEAALAKQREYDEAFVFDGPPDEDFLQAIEKDGLHWTRGEFFHITGDHDKGRAAILLEALYRREYGPLCSIGLGDSLNDLPLLRAVDHAVLMRHEDGSYESRIDFPGLLKTQHPAARGWNDAVLHLLEKAPLHEATERKNAAASLAEIYDAALAAVDPYRALQEAVHLEDGRLRVAGAVYDLAAYERVVAVGAGKASARMALALEALLGERICAGLVIVKQGHTAPLQRIEQIEAAHPVPDAAGAAGAQRVLQLLRAADERTLLICLLSGGASALLVAPAANLTLQDKQQVTGLLLMAGASIGELNAVRKHLSAVKGGRLAQAAFPAQVLTLLLSDVIGDRLDVIASGPTAPDESTFADAWAVIEKYALQEIIPARVRDHLRRGMDGHEIETVKSGDPCLQRTHNVIIGGIGQALAAAETEARRLGFATEIVTAALQGEAATAAHRLAQEARAKLAGMRAGERHCLLYGGETTVTVRGSGKGGRNQELALAFALEIEGMAGISLLSAGTDGNDGPTDAAGALVNGKTVRLARRHGIEPVDYLEDNDSYTFFQRLDELSGSRCHLKTGPSGSNVMDIQIVLCTRGAI